MWISDTSIRRPVLATMFILALVVMGLVSYPDIGVDLFPRVDFPMVSIRTQLIGASPDMMDIDVTDKIEEAVNTITGVKSITSTSLEGYSSILVEFNLERDIDLAIQDVREQLSAVRSLLPDDITEPVIQKVNPDTNPVMWVYMTGSRPQIELSTYADEVLKGQLQRIEGVGSLVMAGVQKRQIRIWVDADKLRAYGVAPSDIAMALGRENVELPGGRIEGRTKEYSIKFKGSLRNIDSFSNLIVASHQGAPVRIRDIGRAEDGMEERRSYTRYNGVSCIGIGIQKQTGSNTVQVADRVRAEVERIRETLPAGMNLSVAFDQSTFIKNSMYQVQEHLILGSILAVIAVFVFLRNVRTTLISAVALPVSIISTFALMRAFGFTFNNLTMLALTLSVGILIDDAIIVIENIHRHIEEGMSPRDAASFATSEIGLAVTATTLAIVVIFLPAAFMKGIIGRFFMQFALTVVFSVLVSLLVSLTLTPMLSSLFLRPKGEEARRKDGKGLIPPKLTAALEQGYDRVEKAYRPILEYCLDHRREVLAGALAIFVVSLLMVRFIGKEFRPEEDQGQFIVRMEAPVDYSLGKAAGLFSRAEAVVKARPEVKGLFFAQGSGSGLMGQINKAVMFTRLSPRAERRETQHEIMAALRQKLKKIPGLKVTIEEMSMLGGGLRNLPVEYVITGGPIEDLRRYAGQIAREYAKVPGIVDVDTSLEAGKPELSVYIDRDKASDLGVSTASIAEAVNLLISGEVDVTKFKDEAKGRRYDVRVRLNPEHRMTPADIGRLYVRAVDGKLVELSNVLSIVEAGGASSITRKDRQRALWIFANLEDKTLGSAMDDLDAVSAKILPKGYKGVYLGEAEEMGKSFRYLMFAILLGILLAYMVLAGQFESFLHPVTVLLAMPLSFIGAFGALLLTGQSISIVSFIGIILLMGLVKKNSILLVDYTNTLRARGMSRRDALMQAGPVRLRPILMTTFAMVLGMLPVALGIGEGSDIRAPMGITVIGGLLTSLFLTLGVVPAAYDLFDEWKERLGKERTAEAARGWEETGDREDKTRGAGRG
ncbi:MAG TPA: efflux RND transporter permease subunit [Deltaproteobacteria bacterium]|nr:efflux RND transporter permease subunit [Deltaproteobacteria bacterium]